MQKGLNRLQSLFVQRVKEPGRHHDGGGLYLAVSATGNKSWVFRYMFAKKPKEMGLGPLALVSLAEARAKATENRRLLIDGKDPIAVRTAIRQADLAQQAKVMTFDQCTKEYIEKQTWKNPKHRQQWTNTLEAYASPVFGKLNVQDIDTPLVIQALQPIWKRIPETASRVRSRIELILAYATVNNFRSGENPARWKGHLAAVFESKSEFVTVKHMPALPWCEIPQFMSELRAKTSLSARALELFVLTWTRPNELIGARASEFNLEQNVWTIPATRMKKNIEHRVPLSPRAVEIVSELMRAGNEILFPGLRKSDKPMVPDNLRKLAREMRPDIEITAHGFRSTGRDWASECTDFPNRVVEMALAHKIRNKVEAAYRRGDLFLKRVTLMNEWAKYCESPPATGATVHDIYMQQPG
jgi:integrase